jgi:ComF family protein
MLRTVCRLTQPIGTVLRGVQDALLPQTCVICGQWIPGGSGPTCKSCVDQLAEITRASYCPRCGRTMPPAAIDEEGCARCKHERFWNVAGVARLGAYGPALQRLTVGLKYHGRERNAEFAADLLATVIAQRGWRAELDFVVPVPMHRWRRWQRPCDHAALLAAAVARRLKIPLLEALRRTKYTPSQTQMSSARQRFENVRGCFALRRGAGVRLAGRCVCIIDNLMATGATAHEVSKVLRRAGARRIYVTVIARAVLPGDAQAAPVGAVVPEPPPNTRSS